MDAPLCCYFYIKTSFVPQLNTYYNESNSKEEAVLQNRKLRHSSVKQRKRKSELCGNISSVFTNRTKAAELKKVTSDRFYKFSAKEKEMIELWTSGQNMHQHTHHIRATAEDWQLLFYKQRMSAQLVHSIVCVEMIREETQMYRWIMVCLLFSLTALWKPVRQFCASKSKLSLNIFLFQVSSEGSLTAFKHDT